jgi:hypothetical protein
VPSGGPRTPAHPAPASGPGRLSRRTDGGPGQVQRTLPNAGYGEQSAFMSAESGAPLALADGALSPSAGGAGMSPPSPMPVTPLNAPSQYPGQPVTNGSPLGPGAGIEALGLSTPQDLQNQDRQQLAQYLPVLEWLANSPTALPSLRSMVRKIKASAGA